MMCPQEDLCLVYVLVFSIIEYQYAPGAVTIICNNDILNGSRWAAVPIYKFACHRAVGLVRSKKTLLVPY